MLKFVGSFDAAGDVSEDREAIVNAGMTGGMVTATDNAAVDDGTDNGDGEDTAAGANGGMTAATEAATGDTSKPPDGWC